MTILGKGSKSPVRGKFRKGKGGGGEVCQKRHFCHFLAEFFSTPSFSLNRTSVTGGFEHFPYFKNVLFLLLLSMPKFPSQSYEHLEEEEEEEKWKKNL